MTCDYCKKCDANPNYYPCCSNKCFDNYTNNDESWIKFADQMPKLKQEIEVKFEDESTYKAKLEYDSYPDRFFIQSEQGIANVKRCKYWRPIKEKRPDFSKLKKDDILLLKYRGCENTPDDIYPVRFSSMNDKGIFTYNSGNHVKDLIKKITRINLEEQTFEEI